MRTLVLGAIAVLCPLLVTAQEPPGAPPASADTAAAAATCQGWTDDPIVPGVTPLRAAHIMELRACLEFLLARNPDPDPEPCREDWSVSGSGEDIIDVPACLDRVRLYVEPGSGTVSRFWFWARDTLDQDAWRQLTAGQVSIVDCRLGLACHFEGHYRVGNAVQVAITVAGGTINWTISRTDR